MLCYDCDVVCVYVMTCVLGCVGAEMSCVSRLKSVGERTDHDKMTHRSPIKGGGGARRLTAKAASNG